MIKTLSIKRLSLSFAAVFLSNMMVFPLAQAQQQVEFNGAIPVAPTGLEHPALGAGPFEYATAEGMDIRVVVVARGIEYPTSMVFLPDNKMLVSTRPGKILLIDNDVLSPEPIVGGPGAVYGGVSGTIGATSGYVDMTLHPDFGQNSYVYLSYNKPVEGGTALTIGRGRWDGGALQDFEQVWTGGVGTSGPGRITFDHDSKLYVTVSGGGPQDLSTVGGTVIRINDDGSIPADNPFVNQAGAKPEIYTYGHRNSLGMEVHPITGEIWQNENGPNGGDEINILKPGLNYGWPLVSLGRTYQGPWQSERPGHENYEPPIVYWMPAIAVSGMAFYTGDALPKWKGDIFVGALRTGEIPGTGHIERILVNEKMEELRRETLLLDLGQRVRDIRQGLDGFIYIATDEAQGAILRIEPAN